MPDDDLDRLIDLALLERARANLLRARRVVRVLDSTHVEIDGRQYVNFSSNNYLGLTHHPDVIGAAARASREHGAGSGAAALISGYTDVHASAERAFAAWKGTESSVLLPSGYQANHAAVQTVAAVAESSGRPVRFVLDKLVHASIIDAVRATGQPMRVFPHNGLAKLERLLAEASSNELQVVITESIFSMDGDAADLRGLAELKRRRAFTLVVDEAHGSGVYGANGSGYASECGVARDVDVFVVTLSKALGSAGGTVCASKRVCDALVNFGRAYIYSTNVPPSIAAAGEAALHVIAREPHRQQRVRALARRVREALGAPGDSPIIPIIVGSEESALRAADVLRDHGILATPVRPPTVARGASRLRVTLSCDHTDGEVDYLLKLIGEGGFAGRSRPAEGDANDT